METIPFTEGLATNSGIPVVGVKKFGSGCFKVFFAHTFDTETGEVTDADTEDFWFYPHSGITWGYAPGHPADLNGPIIQPTGDVTLNDVEGPAPAAEPFTPEERDEFDESLEEFMDEVASRTASTVDAAIEAYANGSAEWRKQRPVYTGVLKYFPDAILEVAHCSFVGNEQHHPGTEVHWDKSKSADEHDAMIRHSLEAGTTDTDGVRHSAKVAWRALAALQREIDADKETALESAA